MSSFHTVVNRKHILVLSGLLTIRHKQLVLYRLTEVQLVEVVADCVYLLSVVYSVVVSSGVKVVCPCTVFHNVLFFSLMRPVLSAKLQVHLLK